MTSEKAASLSERLRDETGAAHASAERTAVMRRVMRGEIDRDTYLALLRTLLTIYEPLEAGLAQHVANAELAPLMRLDMAALRRRDRLAADIAALGGDRDLPDRVASAAILYAERLAGISVSRPVLLAAHAYVRYMGDLSGGQMLRAGVRRALGLSAGAAGLSFYDFPEIEDATQFKHAFRAALDDMGRSDEIANAMVDEARRGFEMHASLFERLV